MVCSTALTAATAATVAAALLGGVAVIGLIVLLVSRELAAVGDGAGLGLFSRHLIVAVIPLLIVFAFIVTMEALQLIF